MTNRFFKTHFRLSQSLLACALLFSVAGCSVGPNYKRPNVDVPSAYRDLPPGQPASATASLGDQKWWEVFQDTTLQSLVRTAVAKNYNVRIAAARVLQAQAQLGITRADQFPSLSGGAGDDTQHSPAIGPIPSYQTSLGQLTLSGAWNLDFWGKYRRATEAARATLLANEWAQKEVIATVVASVADSYFQLRELDLELEISKQTLDSRQQSLDLTRTLTEHGIDTLLDQRQAEELVYTAGAQIPDLERQIAQQENAISILLGNNPGDVPRGLKLTDQPHPPDVPSGLPSALLERRPDVREAEENLVAANAQVGVARAAYFPQISLTASGGYESPALTGLFSGPAGLWNLGASLTQPIFEGGRLRSGVQLAEAQKQELVLTYQQTIQGAFRDVRTLSLPIRKIASFGCRKRSSPLPLRMPRSYRKCASKREPRITWKF